MSDDIEAGKTLAEKVAPKFRRREKSKRDNWVHIVGDGQAHELTLCGMTGPNPDIEQKGCSSAVTCMGCLSTLGFVARITKQEP